MTQDNIVKLSQPGSFSDPLTEVLRDGDVLAPRGDQTRLRTISEMSSAKTSNEMWWSGTAATRSHA